MILNELKYARTLMAMKEQILDHKGKPAEKCSILSVATHVPLLAIVRFALTADMIGPNIELEDLAKSLVKFYGYED